ncbi:phage tail protein [Anaerolineales bacterium]|jgi:phage tail-like protein
MANTITDVSADPLVSFAFAIEVGGKINGFFTEISGMGSETEMIEHKVVTPTGQEVVKKIPGRLKWNDITLKRGITSNMDIWEWRGLVEKGQVDSARVNGSIIMYDQSGGEVARWNFERAWPSKVTGPQAQSDSNAVGVEELTLVCEYMTRVK